MSDYLTVPELRAKRMALGITQEKMAHVAGVTLQGYQRYERIGDMWVKQAVKCTTYLSKIEEAEKFSNNDSK